MSGDTLLHLCSCIKEVQSTSLVELDFSFNPFGDEARFLLAKFVSSSSKLKRLNLMGCRLSTQTLEVFIDRKIFSSKLRSLEYLNFSHNNIDNEGAARLCTELAGARNLQLHLSKYEMSVLHFAFNKLKAVLLPSSCRIHRLLESPPLDLLDLSYNHIGDISSAPSSIAEVKVLDLSYCGLTATTLNVLVGFVRCLHSLRSQPDSLLAEESSRLRGPSQR
jgi:hypothetical protein